MARFAFDLWLTRFIGNSIFRTTIAMNASFTAHCLNLIARAILPAILCIINLGTAYAWIYPEHRSITLRAIQQLDSTHRVLLDSLWRAARIGHEYRLSESAADTLLGECSARLDYAAWPAIGGDHSCSGDEMLHTIRDSDWILSVADIAARTKRLLSLAPDRVQHVNVLRGSDLELLNADGKYATRAGANSVHFLLALPRVDTPPLEYAADCLNKGGEPNALGVYAWYHLSALMKAGRLSREAFSISERSALARAALADEAFALHFLEDSFSAGHVAGTWGSTALRKGTHDYYNEFGLAIVTWQGAHAVLLGDSWMTEEDAEYASRAVRRSIEHFLDALGGTGAAARIRAREAIPMLPETLNVCSLHAIPTRYIDPQLGPLLVEVLQNAPIPGLALGAGSLPRFRSELGLFIGVGTAGRAQGMRGSFGTGQPTIGVGSGLELAAQVGLGLDGVMNESGDGLAFLEIGVRQDRASTTKYATTTPALLSGEIGAAIPGRPAVALRIRMPYYIVPGDLLVLGPFLYLFAPELAQKVGVRAANGGLLPWQAGIATSIGRFQFVLGREVGVAFFGYANREDGIIIPAGGDRPQTLVNLRSTEIDLPILEYRPFHSFSLTQGSDLVLQLNTGFDVPQKWAVVSPAGTFVPDLQTRWFFGLRLAFHWRHYFN